MFVARTSRRNPYGAVAATQPVQWIPDLIRGPRACKVASRLRNLDGP